MRLCYFETLPSPLKSKFGALETPIAQAPTGDVNAPDETSRFLFSRRWPHCEEAAGLDKDGLGVLEINNMELGNLVQSEKANIVKNGVQCSAHDRAVCLYVGPIPIRMSPPRISLSIASCTDISGLLNSGD